MSRKSQLQKKAGDRTTGLLHLSKSEIHYSGPLPPAEQLERYEIISPGFAKAILEMAQSAQQHAQQMERELMTIQKDFTRDQVKCFSKGQTIAAILGSLGIVTGAVVAAMGNTSGGAAIVGVVMGALAASFAWGKWMEHKDDETNRTD